jgi:hypothetical protein
LKNSQHRPAIILFVLCLCISSKADQLQCLDSSKAEEAKALIATAPLIIAYCSQCDDTVLVITPENTDVVKDCRFEVRVSGRVLARTTEMIPKGDESVNVTFIRVNEEFSNRIDLAYVYVEVVPNQFKMLGRQVGLSATVKTESISLPAALYKAVKKKALSLKKKRK